MTLEDFQRGQGPNKDQNPESLNDEAGEEDWTYTTHPTGVWSAEER